MKILIDIPDSEAEFFTSLMNEFGYATARDTGNDPAIPEWHKEIVRKRLAEAKPEDYVPLEDVLKKWGMEDA